MNKDEAFEKYLKLEKQLYDEIDRKVPGSSRDSLKRMDKLRSQIREILPLVNQKKDGGLAEAIDKVKKEDAVKMKRGGMAPARGPRRMGFLGQAVDEFIETMEPFQGVLKEGEQLRNIDGKTMIVRRMPNPNFSDANRRVVRDMLGDRGRMMSDADRSMMMQMMGARRMADGGKVPPKFKGFSKLPEDVQEQMNPTLAKKFKKGGVVKMGKGGGVCRGMGAARAGGKFKLR